MDQIFKASTPQRHVLVIHKGKLFRLDAFDENWNIRVRDLTPDFIYPKNHKNQKVRSANFNQSINSKLNPVIKEMKVKSWETWPSFSNRVKITIQYHLSVH